MVTTATMIDAMGVNSNNIPASTRFVQAYVTGIDGVPWTAPQMSRFSNSVLFKMAQNGGPAPDPRNLHGLDVENLAYTPQEAANMVYVRVKLGIPWTTIYGGDSALANTATDIQAFGSGIWLGHVNCILADWNLNEAEAAARVGTFVHGMTCVGVQWASPSSNPKTQLPGSGLTLAQANCDLNVVDAAWRPDIWNVMPAPPPPPPPPPPVKGVLIVLPNGATVNVLSADNGKTWSSQ